MSDLTSREARCCDNCRHYCWYYDKCDKWQCEVDPRSVCDEFEEFKDE